jgi:dihydroorotate dehydrogenase electron transfer subunit
MVAGGIGVAPLVFLADHLAQRGLDPRSCFVYLGGRSAADLLCADEFLRLGMPVQTTTDDGSSGDQCLVTHPVELALDQHRPDILYACGPLAMLKCVVGIAEKNGIPCQISIESMMACGIGACLGCAVESRRTPERFLHTCMDGPVFDASDINIETLRI